MGFLQQIVAHLGLGFAPRPVHRSGRELDAERAADLEPGHVVGEYVIERKLGEGGFGAVYRAVHPVIGKAAAVKVLHRQYSSNPEMVSRFVAEARAVNQIRHHHIIDIFSFGALDDGRHYYVMELLEGVVLDAYLERMGRLEPQEALPILHAIAKALDAAHAAGIAHRDLKPENVFLATDDSGEVFPKLLDFGIAKLLTTTGKGPAHKTHTGTPIGTPRYMSPEQCQGQKVDERTDIYSFGVIAFRMMTGGLPFDAKTALELMLMHVSSPPPKPSEACADVPAAFDAPILHMLEKDPAQRSATLSEAFEELASAATACGMDEHELRSHISPRVRSTLAGMVAEQREREQQEGPSPGWMLDPAKLSPGYPAATPAVQPPRARLWLAILALAFAAAMLAVVLLVRRPAPAAIPAPASSLLRIIPSGVPTGADAAAPAVSSSAPAMPSMVALRFDTKPAGVEVYRGGEKLGVAPGPIHVRRSNDSVSFTLRAPGFADEVVDVEVVADKVVSVQLKPRLRKPTPTRPDVPEDLEYPF